MLGGLRKSKPRSFWDRFCAYRRHQAANCRSGDFGRLPFFWAALRQAMRLTVYGRYIDFGLMSLWWNVRFGSLADMCNETRMSAMGQKRTFARQNARSASPPKRISVRRQFQNKDRSPGLRLQQSDLGVSIWGVTRQI